MTYDVFLSHASEDKHQVVLPLVADLESRGFRVWLDEFELAVGDSLRRSIDKGLSESSFGVVVLSPAYLEKVWTNRELDGLVARDEGKLTLILPVWHNLTREDVLQYSPTLADKVAVSTEQGLDNVAEQIARAIERGHSGNSGFRQLTLDNKKADELTQIRRELLGAGSKFELDQLHYRVDQFLVRYPGDPEARHLKQHVEGALLVTTTRPKKLSKPPEVDYSSGCMLGISLIVAIAVFIILMVLR